MARTLFIALVAAVIGGGLVYGAMLYLGRNPLQLDVQLLSATPTPATASAPPPTPTPTPAPLPTDIPPPTPTPSPALQLPPTPTVITNPLPTVTPDQSLEQRVVVNAFAECNGQYDGWHKNHRASGARSAIEEGRQTVADIRALVVRYCDGVFPELTAAAIPPTLTPTVPPTSTRPPEPTTTVRPTATAHPTVTVPPTATPVVLAATSPSRRHAEEKRYMLELINEERSKAGLNSLALGNNAAAQSHADASLEGCFSSHWGLDGLKPYMRYSLAGGYQSNGENGSGLDYCVRASDGYRASGGIQARIRETMQGWMASPGHRRNVLDPQHRRVNIGIAWDTYNTAMYQHFEGGYVEYDRLPAIADGILSLSGKARNGVSFDRLQDLGVHIFYDPPPHDLTRGQVARTYCYDNGRRVAGLRQPLTGGYFWTTEEFATTHNPCPSPYDVSTTASPPRSPAEAHRAWQEAYSASANRQPQPITVPWVTASQWTAGETSFSVTADINRIIERHGDGVYSVMLWGKLGGEQLVISQYSIFHGVTPPAMYNSGAK